jgi:hypothetical protein
MQWLPENLAVLVLIREIRVRRQEHTAWTPFIFIAATPHGECAHVRKCDISLSCMWQKFIYLLVEISFEIRLREMHRFQTNDKAYLDDTRNLRGSV